MAVASFRKRVEDCDHLYLSWCSRVLFPEENPTFFNEWIMSPKPSKRSWLFIGATIYKIRLLIILKMFYLYRLCSIMFTLLLICPKGRYCSINHFHKSVSIRLSCLSLWRYPQNNCSHFASVPSCCLGSIVLNSYHNYCYCMALFCNVVFYY